MKTIKKIVEFVDKVVKYLAVAAFSVMTVLIILQVFYRYVLQSSLSFSEELARYLFIWATLLGAAMCVNRRSHVSFDLIMIHLPTELRKYGGLIINLICIFFYAILVIYGIKVVGVTLGQTSPALGVKMGYIYLSIPVSGAVMLLNGIYIMFDDFIKISKASSVKGVETR